MQQNYPADKATVRHKIQDEWGWCDVIDERKSGSNWEIRFTFNECMDAQNFQSMIENFGWGFQRFYPNGEVVISDR